MADNNILRGEVLSKLYLQGKKTIYALRDVLINVKCGEFVMIGGRIRQRQVNSYDTSCVDSMKKTHDVLPISRFCGSRCF